MFLDKYLSLDDLIEVSVIDLDSFVVSAYANAFSSHKNFKFKVDHIFANGPGTLVSPANSYGIMDGGIDKDYLEYFGIPISLRIEDYIENFHAGKLEIGDSQIVPTRDEIYPYIVFAPTIERPGELASSESVYSASKAIFQDILIHNYRLNDVSSSNLASIKTILMPGLGTGFGNLDARSSAFAVKQGYEYVNDNFRNIIYDVSKWDF